MASLTQRITDLHTAIANAMILQVDSRDFTFADPVTVRDGIAQMRMKGAGKIVAVTATVKTAPTGAALIVDMLKNGTTIFTAGTGRPSIAVSGFSAESASVPVNTYADGDLFLPKISQIGSTVAGAGLVVTLWTRRTS